MDIPLNKQAVLEQVVAFLNSDQQVLIITGGAGSGKTSLIPAILNQIKVPQAVKVMAPTGPAVLTIRRVAPEIDAETIHRVIYQPLHRGVEVSADDQIDGIDVEYGINVDNDYALYIVDAASEIPVAANEDDLISFGTGNTLQDLLTATGVAQQKAKIILLGDPDQIAAFTINQQQALNPAFYTGQGLQVATASLGNADQRPATLSRAVKQTREKIHDPQLPRVYPFPFDGMAINAVAPSPNGGLNDQQVAAAFVKLPLGTTKLITNSIERAQEYNQLIRHQLGFGREVQAGDLLTVTRNKYNIRLKAKDHYVYKNIFSGQVLKVIQAYDHVTVHTDVKGTYHLVFRPIQFQLLGGADNNYYSTYLLENVLKSTSAKITNDEIIALYRDFYDRYQDKHADEFKKLKEYNQTVESVVEHRKHDARTNEYYAEAARLLTKEGIPLPAHDKDYKQNVQQLIADHPNTDPKNECQRKQLPDGFYQSLHDDFAYNCIEAQYAYATNVFRALDGQWPNVFVDFNAGMEITGTPTWVYSAISRAIKQLTLVNMPSIFAPRFKVEHRTAKLSKLTAHLQSPAVVKDLDQLDDNDDLVAALVRRLDAICQATNFTLAGINIQYLANNYVLVYLQKADVLAELQVYFSKKGWSAAFLSTDAAVTGTTVTKLIAKINQLNPLEGN